MIISILGVIFIVMKVPSKVKEGDKIAIISTARKISLKEIEYAVETLKTWRLMPVIGKTIGLEDHQFAGTDEARRQDLQNMLDRSDIKGIWCARGGYGTVRIIDQLIFSDFLKNPKWIIGYSDITVLHSHLHTLGVASLHGAMPIDLQKSTETSKSSLYHALFGHHIEYAVTPSKKNKPGNGKGQLVGGNLSILYSLCGSESAIDTTGKILCIEDLDEYLYHIDRMLQNLKRNGYFDQLSGLIVGGMKKMHDNTTPFGKKVRKIILEIVQNYDFPVVFNFPTGHIKDNNTLILGAEVLLEVSEEEVKLSYTS